MSEVIRVLFVCVHNAWLKTVPHEPTKTRGQAPPRN